jgi:L-iditol 2-dehydrogenase
MIVECSGTDAGGIASTVEMADYEGRIRFIGHSIGRKVPIEIGWSNWKGLDLHGHAGTPNFFPRTIKFMAQSKNVVDYTKIITHNIPIEEYKKAFELEDKGKVDKDVMKIMFIMNRQ